MKPLPTIRQLRYFIALDTHQHFGRAAEASFISQSAFSVAIHNLESLMGVSLADRNNRRVTITATGKLIASQARECLGHIEGLMEIASRSHGELTGPLRLGVIPTIAPFLLPKLLPAIRAGFPKLQLYIREEKTEQVYAELANGDLDLILIALPYPLRNTVSHSLFRDRFLLACREDTRLINPKNYSVDQLPAESVLLLEDGHCLRDHALAACNLQKPDAINRFSASSLHTLLEMVNDDLGITFVPEMAAHSALLKDTQIKTLPMDKASFREIGLVWRQASTRETEFKKLGQLISETAARQQTPAALLHQ